MKKKELLALPEMKVTQKMKETVKNDEGEMRQFYHSKPEWIPKIKWLYRAKRTKNVLEIDVFTREMIKLGADYPRYRIFLHDEKYDTWDNIKGKWRTATIEHLEYSNKWSNDWYSSGIWIRKDEEEIIDGYVKNGIGDPRAAVQYWQDWKKNRTELDTIDGQMRLVPDIPKDFKKWERKEVMPQYIFYDAGKKVTKGYCTHCEREVDIKDPKYNKKGKCPHCRHEITYKSRKKSGHLVDWGYAGLFQRTKEGYVYRYFEVKTKYINGIYNSGGSWEMIRVTFDSSFRKRQEFEFGKYKMTNEIRWKYRVYTGMNALYEHKAILYPRNLRKLLKGTKLQYAALEVFAKTGRKFYTEDYIDTYLRNDALEKLVKCGFYNLATAFLEGYNRGMAYIHPEEKSCKKILGLRTEYYKILATMDPTLREFEVAYELQEFSIRATKEEIRYLAKTGRNFAVYIRHTTMHKMIRYMKEQLKSDSAKLRDYHDTLQLAATLGYNLNDEYILFPRNMEERHRQYIEERRERDLEIQKAEDDKKDMILIRTIKQQGWKLYEMETEKFLIRLPEKVHEIRKEGNELHHCVATYIERMLGGKTCILFIREKENPGQAFYTIEVKDGKVIQCRGKHNKAMTEEVKDFVKQFKKRKLEVRERMAS